MRRAQDTWGKLLTDAGIPKDETITAAVDEVEIGPDELRNDNVLTTVVAPEVLVKEEPSEAQNESASTIQGAEPTSPSSPPVPEPHHSLPQILTRRQRLLAQARENARTPLPESLLPPSPEALQAKAEAEEAEKKKEEKEASSMRERLWKLMGGRWVS